MHVGYVYAVLCTIHERRARAYRHEYAHEKFVDAASWGETKRTGVFRALVIVVHVIVGSIPVRFFLFFHVGSDPRVIRRRRGPGEDVRRAESHNFLSSRRPRRKTRIRFTS